MIYIDKMLEATEIIIKEFILILGFISFELIQCQQIHVFENKDALAECIAVMSVVIFILCLGFNFIRMNYETLLEIILKIVAAGFTALAIYKYFEYCSYGMSPVLIVLLVIIALRKFTMRNRFIKRNI